MASFKQGFVINPDSFWTPCYRISPFDTPFISKNHLLVRNAVIQEEIIQKYFGPHYVPCQNGRQAIYIALQQFDLCPDDEVWIITTSGNKYISSCVTKEIEKFCRWSMQKSAKTKLIFLNHEFGFCYKSPQDLKAYNLPIIEDRALSFASQNDKKTAGIIGDFVIYSLPKFFPVNFGGVLKINNTGLYQKIVKPENDLVFLFKCLMSYYLNDVQAISEKRRENFLYLTFLFDQLNFKPHFDLSEYEVPGAFMFRCSGLNLDRFKIFMQSNGVESSVFYGEEAFYIPVHQGLTLVDMEFFFLLTNYFIENGNQ